MKHLIPGWILMCYGTTRRNDTYETRTNDKHIGSGSGMEEN
jgi:hypothetical protein